jgi:hypothetical protein
VRLRFRRRRRCGRPLLVPLIELLFLLLFLLLVSLLYRRRWPYQGMRFRRSGIPLRLCLLLLRPEALGVGRIPILGRLHIPILSRRIFLLLECPRLRVRHLVDLSIA